VRVAARGGDVLVCVVVREGWCEGTLVGPQGWHWRDVLGATTEARELTAGEPLPICSTSTGSRCSNAPNGTVIRAIDRGVRWL
jgi:hypothetical protein